MGNAKSTRSKSIVKHSKKDGSKNDNKKQKNEYDEQEIGILDQIFHEMAVRSPNDTIAKDTFLKFFDLPGILGDRLFEVFDTKKTGVIDWEEFIDGFQRFSKGDASQKMDMLFQLFDLDGKGGITQSELRTVLMSIVTPPNQVVHGNNVSLVAKRSSTLLQSPIMKANENSSSVTTPNNDIGNKLNSLSPPGDLPSLNASDVSLISAVDDDGINIDEVQDKVNEIVVQAFADCDVDGSSRLDPQEFRNWLKQRPEIIEACEDLFVQLAWNAPNLPDKNQYDMAAAEIGSARFDTMGGGGSTIGGDLKSLLMETSTECKACNFKFVQERTQIPPPNSATPKYNKKKSKNSNKNDKTDDYSDKKDGNHDYVILCHASDAVFEFHFCPRCGGKLSTPSKITDIAMLSSNSVRGSIGAVTNREIDTHAGLLKMDIGKFRNLKTRYVRLHGKFLYIYKKKEKAFPETVVFIQGYFVEIQKKNAKFPSHIYIRLNAPVGSTGKEVSLFTDKGMDYANDWVRALERSAQTIRIEKFYDLDADLLGKGSFATVYTATEKNSGRRVAVKMIEKKVIDGKQKEYIRIEMSVMKLVRHPNVMRLERVFETKSQIYMVMPLYLGGDLYEYMKHFARKGLTEDNSRYVIYYVLSALKYLHSVGIVHRDLKPENLLLVEKLQPTNIVITDFGLSKFAAPHEAMKAACGTLSYVAPEVLRMEGYGKEVDLWSTGVIMFLTLRAKLPFHDSTKNRIIARILRQNVQMSDPHWQKVSSEAKDLISKLLSKNPNNRITCENAMKHAWFEPIREELNARKRKNHMNQNSNSIAVINEEKSNTNDAFAADFKGNASVKDIKVYNDHNKQNNDDDGDDDSESDSDESDSAPMSIIRQHSLQKNYQY